jgi:signal transduction histidine kinase
MIEPGNATAATDAMRRAYAILSESGAMASNDGARRAASELERALAGSSMVDAEGSAIRPRTDLRNQFLSAVCHDLKDPLAAILMGVSFLLRTNPPEAERGRRMLEAMRHSGERMHRTVRNTGDYVRVETGRVTVELGEHDAPALLDRAIERTAILARERQVDVAVGDSTDAKVTCDADRTVDALVHLLDNALKASPPGGRVVVSTRTVGHQVRFDVVDHGHGVPVATRPHLFDAYWHATRSPRDGTGFGLAIVKGFVTAQKGAVLFEPGEAGSTFAILLPKAGAYVATP